MTENTIGDLSTTSDDGIESTLSVHQEAVRKIEDQLGIGYPIDATKTHKPGSPEFIEAMERHVIVTGYVKALKREAFLRHMAEGWITAHPGTTLDKADVLSRLRTLDREDTGLTPSGPGAKAARFEAIAADLEQSFQAQAGRSVRVDIHYSEKKN